jgi:hypothetical protein
MKNSLILTLTSLLLISCTTVKRDDHSYSYVYQHNDKRTEDTPSIPKPKKNVEYTTYRQEYNNFKTTDSDTEYLNRIDNTEAPFYNNGMAPQQPRPSHRRDFNPFDNQFINSSYRVNKNMEEKIPDIFGPEGFVRVESKVPHSNPPIINTYYFPANRTR